MDRVFIKQLPVQTLIGVYDWEREGTQLLLIDLDMAWDNRPAAASDQLDLALDYAAVCGHVEAFAAEQDYQLVETFAECLAKSLQDRFAILGIRIRITKPAAIPHTAGVGVEITRGCL